MGLLKALGLSAPLNAGAAVLDVVRAQFGGIGAATANAAPPDTSSAGPEETLYRGNLAGIQAELDAVLRATAPDAASREAQARVRMVVGAMEAAARGGDFRLAGTYADELLGHLAEYQRAVAAHAKRAKAQQDAQLAFETRHAQVVWQIASAIEYKAPVGEAQAIQGEIQRATEQMDLALFGADFTTANRHLDTIVGLLGKFDEALKKHQQAITEQWVREAPKRAFEANFAGIKARAAALTGRTPGPKEPFAEQLKLVRATSAQLQKLLSAKAPDYAAANRQVDELRRQIARYDLSVAAQQKILDDAAEAKAKASHLADLHEVDRKLRMFEDGSARGTAPFDKAAAAVLDRLLQARADYDKKQKQWTYRAKQQAIDQLKVLVADYQAASAAFWERTYATIRASIGDKDLQWALDPAWGDGAMKQQRQMLEQLRRDMDKAAAAKSYYVACEKASNLYRGIWLLKQMVYAAPGGNGGDTVVRPQLLGPPLDAPATYTLLRLLRRDGGGSIDHPDGIRLNNDGTGVLEAWQRVIDLREQWARDLATLKQGEAKIATALGDAKKAAKAIAAGAGGAALRKLIADYVAADSAVREAAQDLKTGFHGCTAAAKRYTGALTEQARLSAQRKKAQAQDKHDAEAKSLDERKNRIRSAASLAASVLDPKEWLSIPAALVSIGAQELGVSLVSESALRQLKAELDLASRELQHIEDALGVTNVEAAVAELEKAASAQNGHRIAFQGKLDQLTIAGAGIATEMKNTPSLAAGARALELRGAFEGANRTSLAFIESAQKLDEDLQQLARRYAAFGSAFDDTTPRYRDAVRATADGNATTLYEASVYLKTLLASVHGAQDDLARAGDKANSNGLYRILPELKKAIVSP